jgi:hypothetical protein
MRTTPIKLLLSLTILGLAFGLGTALRWATAHPSPTDRASDPAMGHEVSSAVDPTDRAADSGANRTSPVRFDSLEPVEPLDPTATVSAADVALDGQEHDAQIAEVVVTAGTTADGRTAGELEGGDGGLPDEQGSRGEKEPLTSFIDPCAAEDSDTRGSDDDECDVGGHPGTVGDPPEDSDDDESRLERALESPSDARRPTTVVPDGDHRLRVTVPTIDPARGEVRWMLVEPSNAGALPASAPPPSACSEAEGSRYGLIPAGHQASRDWSHEARIDIEVPAGGPYRLCLWVIETDRIGRRSYDPPGALVRESFVITPPAGTGVRLWLLDLDLEHSAVAYEFGLHPLNWRVCAPPAGGVSQSHVPDGDLAVGRHQMASPVLLCDSAGYAAPDHTALAADWFPRHDGRPNRWVTDLPTPATPCSGADSCLAEHRVRLPGPAVGAGVCGSGLGGSCDPTTTMQRWRGTALIRVERYRRTAFSTDGHWHVGGPEDFDAGPPPPPAPGPQIDGNASWAILQDWQRPGDPPPRVVQPREWPPARPQMLFHIETDRPTTLRLTPYTEAEGEAPVPCLQNVDGTPLGADSAGLSTMHDVLVAAPCWGRSYLFTATVTDVAGVSAVSRPPFGVVVPALEVHVDQRDLEVLSAPDEVVAARVAVNLPGTMPARWDCPAVGSARPLPIDSSRDRSVIVAQQVRVRIDLVPLVCPGSTSLPVSFQEFVMDLDDLARGPVTVESAPEEPVRFRLTMRLGEW